MPYLDELRKKDTELSEAEKAVLYVSDPQRYDAGYINPEQAAADLARLKLEAEVSERRLEDLTACERKWFAERLRVNRMSEALQPIEHSLRYAGDLSHITLVGLADELKEVREEAPRDRGVIAEVSRLKEIEAAAREWADAEKQLDELLPDNAAEAAEQFEKALNRFNDAAAVLRRVMEGNK